MLKDEEQASILVQTRITSTKSPMSSPLKALTSVSNTTLALSLTRILAFQNPGSALGSQGRAAWSGLGDCRGALRPRHPPPATGVGFIAISFRSQLSFGRYFSTAAHIQIDIKSPLCCLTDFDQGPILLRPHFKTAQRKNRDTNCILIRLSAKNVSV